MADYTMFRGDTLIFDGTATTAAGAAQDLTGCTLWMTAKYAKTDADSAAVFQLSSGALGGIAIGAGTGGTFTVTVAPSKTSGLTAKKTLYYDVQLEDAMGNFYTVDSGTITVDLDVTVTTTP